MQDKGKTQLQSTPISIPGWDASKAADSFRAFARHIHGMAKDVLLRDGRHAEMFFFMPLSGRGHIALWRSNERDLEAEWLRRHIRESYAFGVVHVVETWMRLAPPGDHVLRQVMGGEIKVSELRKEDRKEALMVGAQSRDGWATSWVDEIIRDGAGKLSLGACREFGDFRGRFGGLFG